MGGDRIYLYFWEQGSQRLTHVSRLGDVEGGCLNGAFKVKVDELMVAVEIYAEGLGFKGHPTITNISAAWAMYRGFCLKNPEI